MALAALPFDNMTGDAGRAYLADGLTEETIAAMGQVAPDHLSVIGRTSVMRYRNTANLSLISAANSMSAISSRAHYVRKVRDCVLHPS